MRVGAAGCLVAESAARSEVVPGFSVNVVDTNGAGDTHLGAFAAGLARGQSPVEAAHWANAAAAWSVTEVGPATGPTLQQLDEFLLSQR